MNSKIIKFFVYSSICLVLISITTYLIYEKPDAMTKEISKEINSEQWGLLNVGQQIKEIKGVPEIDVNAVEAWEITKGEKNVLVGILDTGIDISNPIFQNNIFINSKEIEGNGIDDDQNGYVDDIHGWDFLNNKNTVYDGKTYDYHGTFIASLIAGKHTDSNKVWGIAPNISILPLKFMQGSKGSIDGAIEGIEYGYKLGVRIFNLSWDTTIYDNDLFRTIKKYEDAIFITSSGKQKYNVDLDSIYPCNFKLENIVCVSAIDNIGELEEYSGYGENLVSAPGVDIYGALPEGDFSFSNGSSFATAYITGIVALAKSVNPNITSKELVEILTNSHKEVNNGKSNIKIINAREVLDKVITLGEVT